jgi:flagellar basal body-associated protein FliL
MADGADVNGLRDRVTKLEFETSQRPTRDFVQGEDEKVLAKAAQNDRERNETLLKLIDERLGANRSAILTDLARDHQEFREEVRQMLKDVVKEEVPDAVRAEVRAIKAEEELAKQKAAAKQKAEEDAREKRWLKIKLRLSVLATTLVVLGAFVTLWFSFKGETEPNEIQQMNRASDSLSSL